MYGTFLEELLDLFVIQFMREIELKRIVDGYRSWCIYRNRKVLTYSTNKLVGDVIITCIVLLTPFINGCNFTDMSRMLTIPIYTKRVCTIFQECYGMTITGIFDGIHIGELSTHM
ncbi:hypothetical protein ACHAWU_002096 [Discostella pseudostelligera]|uniref:Uncharacterized protein n=1 Tax=Discostella pseudostelligera TaxID=259834 RepID=A0ABD3M5J1_9STRA